MLAVHIPDEKVLEESKSYPLNHFVSRSLIHSVFLLAIILLGYHTFHGKPIWAVLYVFVSLGAHVSWVRYYSCTRCPHYGRVCPSLLYAGILGSRWFQRRAGRWDMKDWTVLFLTWGMIVFIPAFFALVRGRILLTVINLLFVLVFILVHNELGCRACRNASSCPKGVFAHNPTLENFLRMFPFVGEKLISSFFG